MTPFQVAPYLRIRRKGDGYETRGVLSCSLGHKLPRAEGGDPEGVFAEWEWSGSELRVTNCRYGFYPLFYCASQHEICVSPSLETLLAAGAPAALDAAGLAVFLRIGFFVAEDTPFQAIKQLPPNAVLRWKDGDLRLTSQLHRGELLHISRAEAVERYAVLFKAAIQRRLPGSEDFSVPISGGRDSRHILFELLENGCRPKFCVTAQHFPPRPNPDVPVAMALCQALNMEHIVLNKPVARVCAELDKNRETNFCTEEHAWALGMRDFLRGKVTTLYDGLAGDILSAGLYQTEEKLNLYVSDRRKLASALFESRTREIVLSTLLTKRSYEMFDRELAMQHLLLELEKHRQAPNPIASFYFWNRTRRAVGLAPFAIFRDFHVHCPYLDHALFDFLASLPPGMTLDQRLHTETIQYAYPKFREIPYEKKQAADFVAERAYFRRLARELLFYMAMGRSSKMMRNSLLIPRLTMCAIDGNAERMWWGAVRVLYLLQLEDLTRKVQ